MIKAVVFDADNTLYITEKNNAYEEQFSYLEKEARVKKDIIRERWEKIKGELASQNKAPDKARRPYSITYALVGLGVEPEKAEKLSRESLEIFWKAILRDLVFDKEVRKILQGLKKKYKLIIASDEFEKELKMKLNRVFIDWRKYFRFLVTPDIVGEMKPSQKYYETILSRAQLKPEEVVVVGDSWEKDLEPAKALGIKTILVNEKVSGAPTHWISNIKEITEIL